MIRIIVLATAFGPKHGGVNAFNEKLCGALAACGAKVTCVVPVADLDARASAQAMSVDLVHTGTSELSVDAITEALSVPDAGDSLWWLGHDRVTGPIAASCRERYGGSLALVHHMNFGAYTDFKWAGEQSARDREAEQRRVFEAGDVLFAVGPLLRDSLRRLVDHHGAKIIQLVPGLDDDLLQEQTPPGPFRAVVFGRLGPEDDPIKQGRLAVAAVSSAMASAREASSGGLLTNARPEIDVIGLERHNAEVFRDIQELARSYARGGMWPLPRLSVYTEDRTELRRILRNAHAAIMPSWHEGFGLVGWEAVAAGVPLLLSQSTGLFQLIQEHGTIHTDDVASFRIAGQVPTQQEPEPFTPLDVQEVAGQIVKVASAHEDWKARALRLRATLSSYSWKHTAETMLSALSGSGGGSGKATERPPRDPLPLNPIPTSQSRMPALGTRVSLVGGDAYSISTQIGMQVAGVIVPSPEGPSVALPSQGVVSGTKIDDLIGRARQLRLDDDFTGAKSALDQASHLLALPADPLRSGRIAVEMGIIERIQGNLSSARSHFLRALDNLPETEGIARAGARLQFGILLRQQDDRTASRRELRGARDAFRRLLSRDGEGQASLEMGELDRLEGDYEAALARLNEARTAFEGIPDRHGLANVERTIGSIERLRDRPREALQYLLRAQQKYEAIPSQSGLALTLFELAEAHAQLSEYDQAIQLHHRAMELSKEIGFHSGVRGSHLALANLEARRNRLNEAVEGFRRALDYARSVQDQLGEMQARTGLASVLIKLEGYADAGRELEAAYGQALALRDTGLRSQIRFNQALLALRLNDLDVAASGFREALTLAEDAQDIASQARALQGLGETMAYRGAMADAEVALRHARLLFQQTSMAEDAAIAGLSLASIRVDAGDRASCELLRTVLGELRQLKRFDVSQRAQELLDQHCKDNS